MLLYIIQFISGLMIMPKKFISIDLDGVLNNYSGNYEKDKISSLREGALDFIKKLASDFNIEIYTVRDKELVKDWLKENDLIDFVFGITNEKNPKTSIFLDDRAINFNGDFQCAYESIQSFKPHWK